MKKKNVNVKKEKWMAKYGKRVRSFSEKEIQEWIADDILPEELHRKVKWYWENLS